MILEGASGNALFPIANVQAKRSLKHLLEKDADQKPTKRENIAMPTRVIGAIEQADVLYLQRIKQEIFDDVKSFEAWDKLQK